MMNLNDAISKLPVPKEILILVGTLLLFLISNSIFRATSLSFVPIIFGILIVIEMLFFVGSEMREGAINNCWKEEAIETGKALLAAVIFWFALCFVLSTSSPISAVVSCSMLPNLNRGDFILVQGSVPSAYLIDMNAEELRSLNDNAFVTYSGGNITINGSIFPYCLANSGPVCEEFKNKPENVVEQKGVFTYHYQACGFSIATNANANRNEYTMPCVKSITFKGRDYLTNFSNDVIVYQPRSSDYYAAVGDIVHRAMFRINYNGTKYYLTRGDNNPILDVQVYDYVSKRGNAPINEAQLRGREILSVPYLGYYKLFLSGFFNEDTQCMTQLKFDHTR